jgi:DNA invertase Pin-like site-specific DNA recombinase
MDTLEKLAYNQFIVLAHNELRYAVKIPNAIALILAFSYLRFSSPGQADGDSVRRQTALRNAWLKKHPKVRLDTSVRLEDKGVSGYKGTHRKNKKHALAQFLDLVERGRVPVGSYLIVENLDRLSREHPLEVMALVGQLVRAGIIVVQLEPEVEFTADMDEGALCMLLLGSIRGHGESQRKSDLCGAAWTEKKEQARRDKTPHGRMCPAWIELAEGSYRLKADAAATVRKIFQWCVELGTFALLERLNREGIPTFGRSGKWGKRYLAKILHNRAVLGEYQPHKGSRGPERQPEGEPVSGYYPAVIDEKLWSAAHKAIKSRQQQSSGRPPVLSNNPFSGMLYSALDGAKLHVMGTNGAAYRYLVSADAVRKAKGSKWRTFPLKTFVDGVLSQLREVTASSVFQDPGAERVTVLSGRLDEVDKRLNVAKAKFDADPESPTWASMVDRYDREKRALVKELAEARLEAQHPQSATWVEAVQLMGQNEPGRLRAALMETVEGVWCVLVARGTTRICAAQVWFQSGKRRDYLFVHKGGTGGAVGSRPPGRWGDSLVTAVAAEDLDLRRPEAAATLEADLLKLDLSLFCTPERAF